MERHNQLYFFLAVFAGIILLTVFVFQPFLAILAVSATLAAVCNRLHEKILKIVRFDSLSAFLTTLIVLILVLVPFTLFVILVFNEAASLYVQVSSNGGKEITDLLLTIQRKLRVVLPALDLSLNKYLLTGLEWIIGNMSGIFARVAQSLFMFFLGFFALFYFIKDGKHLLAAIARISPLPDAYDRQIFNRLERAVTAVITGSLVVSIIQGILVGLGFLLFGIPNSALWGGVAAVAALVPGFGTSLVVIPGVLYLFFTSNTASAIGLAIWGATLVGLIDNILVPTLVWKRTNIHPFVVFLSVIGGISFFGIFGILLGPLVISLLFAFSEIYFELTQEKKP